MIKEMRSVPTAQIVSELERDYEAVLDFRHDLQELCGKLDDLVLSDVCEADEIYVTAGEKGIEKEDASPRERGLSCSTPFSPATTFVGLTDTSQVKLWIVIKNVLYFMHEVQDRLLRPIKFLKCLFCRGLVHLPNNVEHFWE